MHDRREIEESRKLFQSDYSQRNLPQAQSKLINLICRAAWNSLLFFHQFAWEKLGNFSLKANRKAKESCMRQTLIEVRFFPTYRSNRNCTAKLPRSFILAGFLLLSIALNSILAEPMLRRWTEGNHLTPHEETVDTAAKWVRMLKPRANLLSAWGTCRNSHEPKRQQFKFSLFVFILLG